MRRIWLCIFIAVHRYISSVIGGEGLGRRRGRFQVGQHLRQYCCEFQFPVSMKIVDNPFIPNFGNSELKPRVVCVGCERFFTIPLIRQVWRDRFISHRFSRPTSSLWSCSSISLCSVGWCARSGNVGRRCLFGLRGTESVLYASLFLRGERVVGTTRCVHVILCSDQ